MFGWFKNRRRRKLLGEPISSEWMEYLTNNVRHFATLSDSERQRLCDSLRIIVVEKYWEGCEGLQVDDEMKVTIAGQASLLLLGVEPGYYFDGVRTILVYPQAMVRSGRSYDDMLVDEDDDELLGEAWHDGPIVLSWPDVLHGGRNSRDGRNLVLHEFAHHLDGLDGEMGGSPPLANRDQEQRWYRVTEREFQRLARSAARGKATLLDHYGASDKAEFFAVATECFFERPVEMRDRHAELYEILKDFYRQDPAERES